MSNQVNQQYYKSMQLIASFLTKSVSKLVEGKLQQNLNTSNSNRTPS